MRGCIYGIAVVSHSFLFVMSLIGGIVFWPIWILSVVLAITWPKESKE
jgi:hypothetical protein